MTNSAVGAPAPVPASPVAAFAALGDETRWAVLEALSGGEATGDVTASAAGPASGLTAADPAAGLTASALAARLPVTRQAIAKHLVVLEAAGLVESWSVGRERRYRALGAELTALGRRLERIGDAWEARLGRIAGIAEELEKRERG
ncbi:ArsR/SmtB family transcription factor [Promicromonospora sukumoe]|uniref:ArsR/SmtB family transcription factor n=1 Tax=Promicromonospora sukumoe TaxID=88382 RepID=UPI0006878D50|nr:helix-turn-helix domain-containing protein [Promicromonospora sukumoe]